LHLNERTYKNAPQTNDRSQLGSTRGGGGGG
jgi:hypothetical protein